MPLLQDPSDLLDMSKNSQQDRNLATSSEPTIPEINPALSAQCLAHTIGFYAVTQQ